MFTIGSDLFLYDPVGLVISTVFASLFSGLVVVIVTYLYYISITPPELRNAEIIPLRSAEIAEQVVNLVTDVDYYWFLGRSGSYFRAQVLPELDNIAREKRRHIGLVAVLPNPNMQENRQFYRDVRRQLKEEADEDTLLVHILATIIAIIALSSNNRYLQTRIGLCRSVPVLRYDVSTAGALITRDAPSLPAILCAGGNPYHDTFVDAVENEYAQSAVVAWNAETWVDVDPYEDQIFPDAVRQLSHFGSVDDKVVRQACEQIKLRRHRYAPAHRWITRLQR